MVTQKAIQLHEPTFNKFRLAKIKFSAIKGKQLSDNDFQIIILKEFIKKEKIKLE